MRKKNIILSLIESELQKLEEYNDHVESALASELRKIGERSEEFPEHKQDEFFDWFYVEIANMRDAFPQLLRSSLLFSVYALLEHELDFLCRWQKNEKKLSLNVSDLRDKGIIRSQNYFKKVVGISFPDSSDQWSRIQACQALRNHMAHSGGLWQKIDLNDDKDKALERKLRVLSRSVTVVNSERIQMGENLIHNLITDVRWLITELVNSV